jgi:hypothetical protein
MTVQQIYPVVVVWTADGPFHLPLSFSLCTSVCGSASWKPGDIGFIEANANKEDRYTHVE